MAKRTQPTHGDMIRAARAALGFSQQKTAELAGISMTAMTNAERSKSVDIDTLAKIAVPLKLDVGVLARAAAATLATRAGNVAAAERAVRAVGGVVRPASKKA